MNNLRSPQALHKVLAPSGPLLHSGVSRMLHEWHFPGGEALYRVSVRGKFDKGKGELTLRFLYLLFW